ncbi:MAG: hypothetical protein ACKOCM_08405 [Cyanobacteriota bacterium]
MKPLVRITTVASGLTAALLATAPVQAELPPFVYADQQRRAEVVVVLRVVSTLRSRKELTVQARVLDVKRQAAPRSLRQGQIIGLRYDLPIWHRQGWVGPSPLPVLRQGQKVTAWLDRDGSSSSWFRPAAGGLSFGPSLEEPLPQERP